MNNKSYLKARFNKNELSTENKKCVLLVSVGQKYHEEEWLDATINLINKSHFSECTIAVADTLQRHNFQDKSVEEAYTASLEMGYEWLERNSVLINKLTPKVTILRWDDALSNPNYTALKQNLETVYLENKIYNEAVNSTISTFLERIQKRNPNVDLDVAFSNCLKYLIEECPIIMPLWASQGYDFVIYPKVMTNAMAMTYELFVKSSYPNKGNWLSLAFKKLSIPPAEARINSHFGGNPNSYNRAAEIN